MRNARLLNRTQEDQGTETSLEIGEKREGDVGAKLRKGERGDNLDKQDTGGKGMSIRFYHNNIY